METAQAKPWWKSRTLWWNVLMVALMYIDFTLEQFPEVSPYLLPISAMGNAILRLDTSKKLTVK